MAAIVIGCGGGSDIEPADVVLRSGKIITMDSNGTIAQAVTVRGGRIASVGSDADAAQRIGSSTKVVDLAGRMLMPGFIDAHLHPLSGGRAHLLCDLAYQPLTRAQLAAKLQACLDASTSGEPDAWLEAVNWDRQSKAALDADPTKELLDALNTQRPIAITSSDFHAVLANSRAFAIAGIDASTPDPAGGSFLRDASGAPSGICVDAASFQLKAAIPPDSEGDLMKQGRAALAARREQGITSFMDAAAGDARARIFKALRDAGELTARVNLAINLDPAVAGTLRPLMLAAVDAGLDMHLHATGERAVRTVLDAVAATRQARPAADFRPALARATRARSGTAWRPRLEPSWPPGCAARCIAARTTDEGLTMARCDRTAATPAREPLAA